MEKLIEKNLTRKQQVDELEKVWEFLSENKLEDLFENLVGNGVTSRKDLLNISSDTIHEYNLGLNYAEQKRLLSVLKKVESQ